MLSWVFFDVDQTLCDFEASLRHAVSSTVLEIRRRHPGDAADRLTDADLDEARAAVAATASPTASMEQIRRQSLAVVLERIDPGATTADVDAVAASFFAARYEQPNLYPDTIAALEVLGTSYRLGIITNGNSYPRHLGLHRYFAEVLLSTDVGVAKPDPAIYRLAAIAAGWHAVRLERDGTATERDKTNGPVIGSLAELPAVLDAM